MQDQSNHPLYIVSFITIIITISILLATLTWFCYNSMSNFIDVQPITLTGAFLFVFLFRILEWGKQILFELIFEKYE